MDNMNDREQKISQVLADWMAGCINAEDVPLLIVGYFTEKELGLEGGR